jgi:hypothetical protein
MIQPSAQTSDAKVIAWLLHVSTISGARYIGVVYLAICRENTNINICFSFTADRVEYLFKAQ